MKGKHIIIALAVLLGAYLLFGNKNSSVKGTYVLNSNNPMAPFNKIELKSGNKAILSVFGEDQEVKYELKKNSVLLKYGFQEFELEFDEDRKCLKVAMLGKFCKE